MEKKKDYLFASEQRLEPLSPELWNDKKKRGKHLVKAHREANREPPPPIVPILGRELKAIRKREGVLAEKLSSEAGISPTWLSLLENGKVNPSVGMLWKIAEKLGYRLEISIVRKYAKKDGSGETNY